MNDNNVCLCKTLSLPLIMMMPIFFSKNFVIQLTLAFLEAILFLVQKLKHENIFQLLNKKPLIICWQNLFSNVPQCTRICAIGFFTISKPFENFNININKICKRPLFLDEAVYCLSNLQKYVRVFLNTYGFFFTATMNFCVK